jgi:phosphoribosylamine---glycine ligase
LEFNCRLGDPETEVIMLRADFDFAEVCRAAAAGSVRGERLKWSPPCAMCVVLAADGYPERPTLGNEIHGINKIGNSAAVVFHAGTKLEAYRYYTTGGRVAMVCSRGKDVASTRPVIYDTLSSIALSGGNYRRDIGTEFMGSLAAH